MRATHKLQRQGNSLCVAIPRPMVHRLRWMLGAQLHIEIDEHDRLVVEEQNHRYQRLAASKRFVTALRPPSDPR